MKIQAVFVLFLTLLACSVSRATTLDEIVNRVSINSYSNWHVRLYTSNGCSRAFTTGTNNVPRVPAYQHDLARDYIFTNFQNMGYTTSLDPFAFTQYGYEYTNCNNVVAIKPGSGGTNVFIIGAHYDTVDAADNASVTLCPGADDNASGVAALLESARAIKDISFRDTIIFFAFDGEEKGFKGSWHVVKDYQSNTNLSAIFNTLYVGGMISLDMIAYNDTNTPWRVIIGDQFAYSTNSPLNQGLVQAATNYTSLEPLISSGWNLSDHVPFTSEELDAVTVVEGDLYTYESLTDTNAGVVFDNQNYHSDTDSTDTPGHISYPYATEVTRMIVGYLCDQAGAIPPVTLKTTVGGNLLHISWFGSPNVGYSLYGTDMLSPTNPWTFMQTFPPAGTSALFSTTLDTSTSTQFMFKVRSE